MLAVVRPLMPKSRSPSGLVSEGAGHVSVYVVCRELDPSVKARS